jgi:hypothetical protein
MFFNLDTEPTMRKILVLVFIMTLSGTVNAESYPTMETVRMVIKCMQDLGGMSEETLYTCACRHDVITSSMSFHDFEQGNLFERYRDMPGKRGGLFRDAKDAREMAAKLQQTRQMAAKACPVVRHIEAPSMRQGERVTDEEMED